ncbi:MAG: hypothetical protein O7G85_01655 [Planctomycetota bacterium]|nr:hypothetical protein [Planctomycetota bacterium]
MGTERILITVRTYPNLSVKYNEVVCTGGITEDGDWRRLYPIQHRSLEKEKQYKTFDIVNVKVSDTSPDGRPESRRPDCSSLQIEGHLDDPHQRWDWIGRTALESMAELEQSEWTLRPVRVSEILKFEAEEDSHEWSQKQKEILRQESLFGDPKPLEKIPYDFKFTWKDGLGKEYRSKFIAWEVGQTWRRMRDKEKVIQAFWDKRFSDRYSLYFFMGNFAAHRQHYGVCGIYNPPREVTSSESLF